MPIVPVSQQASLFDDGKRCTGCGATKRLSAFAPRSDQPGKSLSRCRPCQTEYLREYARNHREQLAKHQRTYNESHPERVIERNRKYRETHAEQMRVATAKCRRERQQAYAAYARQYNRAHRIESAARTKQYADRNREKVRDLNRAYRLSHQEELTVKQRAIGHRYRARKRGSTGSFSVDDWERIKARYNWTCLRCGKREPDIKLTTDHVVPLLLGGWNVPSNLQPLCARCNASKGGRFRDYRPDLFSI